MLKLQKIELLGFKSFADKTEIVFGDSGVAAIVGPNGCGKSNISDAIHWVLGEQSAKTLRSGRMQDVIFNGTRGRKATGMAEVHLTLVDNERQPAMAVHAEEHYSAGLKSPVEAAKESGSITVTRRLYASGESDYMINGKSCRLRDVQELFMGTGLGPDAYAVIEQGRVGQILTAKPWELRGLIEEAAGVTKFKAKRKLAWAKLESSKQNLSRVNDILEEITRQLNSLKRQAARAQRYTELRDQMRAQLRTVLVNNYREREAETTAVATELTDLSRSLQEQLAAVESREAEQKEMHQAYEREEAELRQASEQRSSLRLEAERTRNQTASQAQQIGYLSSRIDEAATEKAALASRLAELQAELAACSSVLSEIEASGERLAEELKEADGRFQGAQGNIKDKERVLAQLRQEMLDAVGYCATLRNQVLQLEQHIANTDRQIERVEGERASNTTERTLQEERNAEIGRVLAGQRENLASIQTRRAALEESLRTGREDESRQRVSLDKLKSDLASQRGRMHSLQEVLDRHSYSTETVKRLFGSGGGKSGEAAGFRPVGVLADFIEVDPVCERSVEEFLREELDYIVVKDWEAAQQGIQILRNEVAGRATFLLHSGVANRAAESAGGAPHPYESLPGVVGALESKVKFSNGLAHAAGEVLPKLRNCYLVENAQAGQALASAHSDAIFLSPDGDWFHGDLVTAGKGGGTGPLALKRELRELVRVVADREEESAKLTAAIEELRRSIEERQAALQSLVAEQQEAEKSLVMAERDAKEIAAHIERISKHLETIGLEEERLRSEAARSRAKLAADTEEISKREARKFEVETEMATISGAMTALEAERDEAHRQANDARSRMAALVERRRASAEALSRIERSVRENTERIALLEKQHDDWTAQRASYEESNTRLAAEAAQAERRSEELAIQVAEMETRYEARRVQLAHVEEALQAMRRGLEEIREKKTAAEVQSARLDSEMGHIKETCRNEFEMEMETLAAEQTAPLAAEELAAAEENYRQIKARIDGMGPINMMALEEYEECRQRHEFLEVQKQDLLDSIRDTTQAIEEIDDVSQRQFTEAFEQINRNFGEVFVTLFGGGQGLLRLTEAENAADRGVEIVAQPPGKKLQSVLLLSGGEKAMTALALLMATFRYKPSPFCVLDEVDAPLDEANVGRFARMVQEMSGKTQFILITHSKKTMSVAPVLYGVTMEEPGVSKIVSVKFSASTAAAKPVPEITEVAV